MGLDAWRNKKIKGTTSKKQKEKKEMELNYKLTQSKKQLERIEELKGLIEILEGGTIKDLKIHLNNYIEQPDEDANKVAVDQELHRILEIAEIKQKA